mmetsp:Transcript_44270/g.118104  ORF Transcript_44270/g.118104 Transcript_44270/m.118104 type:complete len:262 (+) Transcript_44270:347-1132(+)
MQAAPLREEPGAFHRDALRQPLLEQHIDRRDGRRARQRVAAERRRVEHRVLNVGPPGARPRHEGARRHHPAAKRLAQAEDVGHDAPVLEGEHAARAPHARLHFVEEQQAAVRVAKLAHRLEVPVGRDVDAALALHGLQQHARHLGPREVRVLQGVAQVRHVTETHVREADRGREGLAEHGLAGASQSAQGLAMEAPGRGNEVLSASSKHRHLKSTFHRLRAAVGEEGILKVGRGHQLQNPCQMRTKTVDQFLRVESLALKL